MARQILLDVDDIWLPTFLERTIEALATSSAALAYKDYLFSLDDADPESVEVNDASFPSLVISDGLIPMGSFLIRRDVVDEVGVFDEGIDRGEGYAWLLQVAARFDTVRVPEKLFLYRRNSQGQLMTHSLDSQAGWRRSRCIYVVLVGVILQVYLLGTMCKLVSKKRLAVYFLAGYVLFQYFLY